MKRTGLHRSNVPRSGPPTRASSARPQSRLPKRPLVERPPAPAVRPALPKRSVARIIDQGDRSLVDVLDSLLNQGVVLNADLVLALADVDLVYVRLSALLVAADRVLPRERA
jgi:hypothetical protein